MQVLYDFVIQQNDCLKPKHILHFWYFVKQGNTLDVTCSSLHISTHTFLKYRKLVALALQNLDNVL